MSARRPAIMRQLFFLSGLLTFPAMSEAQGSADNLEIISSVVIQSIGENSHYIYPAGIPILTDAQNDFYSFRIEQYFNYPIDPMAIKPYVHSNWILDVGQGFDGKLHEEVARHLRMARPICEEVNYLYRCYIDLELVDPLPEGNLGITLSYDINGNEIFPMESSFTFIVLNDGDTQDGVIYARAKAEELLPESIAPSSLLSARSLSKSLNAVGQISIEGKAALGSGFVVGELERILPIFDRENILGKGFYPSKNNAYIVTAAHLFPNLYLPVQSKLIGGKNFIFSENDSSLIYFFSPSVKSLATGQIKLRLVAASLEADLALLEADPVSLELFLSENSLTHLPRLNIASAVADETRFLVLGFPSKEKGKISALIGGVTPTSWNTRESTNFSPLPKMKLKSISEEFIGSSGLSGGPVINHKGEVVGVTLEKADFGTSVIAINLVSVQEGVLATPISHLDCRIFFNPYELTLTLVNNKPSNCNNKSLEGFGSHPKLRGIWQFQEVLGFSKQANMQKRYFLDTLSEQSIIHGHVIIFDKAIVDGTNILKTKPDNLVLDPSLWSGLGDEFSIKGYNFNPNNFKPLEVKGIRVTTEGGDGGIFSSGSIVTAYRDSVRSSFTAVSSLRDFVEWMNNYSQSPDFMDLICFDTQYCG